MLPDENPLEARQMTPASFRIPDKALQKNTRSDKRFQLKNCRSPKKLPRSQTPFHFSGCLPRFSVISFPPHHKHLSYFLSSSNHAHRSAWQASDSLLLYALVYAVSRRISFLFAPKKTLRELLKGFPTRPFSYSVLLSHNRSNWKMDAACSGKAASQ